MFLTESSHTIPTLKNEWHVKLINNYTSCIIHIYNDKGSYTTKINKNDIELYDFRKITEFKEIKTTTHIKWNEFIDILTFALNNFIPLAYKYSKFDGKYDSITNYIILCHVVIHFIMTC